MELSSLLAEASALSASDVHLSVGEPPIMRIDGDLVRCSQYPTILLEELEGQVTALLRSQRGASLTTLSQVDFAIEIPSAGRVRCNYFRHARGLSLACRLIPHAIPPIETLGLPSVVSTFTSLAHGLVLITGPTGSGKSTTLAALIDAINISQGCHVVTIEDPIEFIHTPRRALIHQREVGLHTDTFATALRAALREDPDVILVGELRDLETIQLALTAAETGHLVFASIHSGSAPKTIDRMIDVFPAAQQSQVRSMLAESIQGIVSQTLLPRKEGGRVVAAEVLIATPAVRNLIREAKTHQIPGIMEVSRNVGMQTLDMHVRELASVVSANARRAHAAH
jgi:twitching motility protein PilT